MTNPDLIKHEAVNHFSARFFEKDLNRPKLVSHQFKQLTSD